VLSSDLPGVNPATLNGVVLYYRLIFKRSGFGDSTELSRVGLSHKGCMTWCPKRLQDKDHTYISGSMDERIRMSSRCLAQPQQKTIGYIWIFISPMKSTFQWIKRQGNWRFLQADVTKSLKVAHAEILDSKQCWSETAIAPSIRLRLWWMSTH
jgi:hypothetical protein